MLYIQHDLKCRLVIKGKVSANEPEAFSEYLLIYMV